MATNQAKPVIENLRRVALRLDGAGKTDGQLLESFVSSRDEAAFDALVRRHGSMVWAVCHRCLRHQHDAEDAFQATFLVLARKAGSVCPREMVGNWLYGVAHTTAIRAKAATARQRVRERQVTNMPEPALGTEGLTEDLQALLDQELKRLPKHFRTAIVLCDLEGRSRREVARQLQIPEGTLSSRLTNGRRLLAKKLARHGVASSGVTIAGLLSQNAVAANMPAALVASTSRAAAAAAVGSSGAVAVSSRVAVLAEGVMKAMLLSRLKIGVAFLVAALLAVGSGMVIYQACLAQAPDHETIQGPALAEVSTEKDAKSVKAPASAQPGKKEAPVPKQVNKPVAWFEGSLAEFNPPGVPGKDDFGRLTLQGAKDKFMFSVTTETKIIKTIGGKQQPGQFTDLTQDSTIHVGYNGKSQDSNPPWAFADEIVIVKAAPIPPDVVFEGTAEVGPGVPFQGNGVAGTFLLNLSKSKDRIVFHETRQTIFVKFVDNKQTPAVFADITNGSKLRVIGTGVQDASDPPQMEPVQVLIEGGKK